MRDSGLTVRTLDVAPPPGRVRGVSAGVGWQQLQPSGWDSFAASVLAPLDAVLATLALHGGWCVLRVICGAEAPTWLYGAPSAANGGQPVRPISLVHRGNTGQMVPMTIPVPWDAALPIHYTWLLRCLARWASQPFDASGRPRSDVLAFVPVAMPTGAGSEMTLTTQGIAANTAAWDAVEPDNHQRQVLTLAAWQEAMAAHELVLAPVGVRSAVAFGQLFGDQLAGSHALLAGQDWSSCYPMVTNLRVGSDGTTYRSWSPAFADLLAAASKVSPTVCQTAAMTDSGGKPGLAPAQLPAAVHDAATTYRCTIVETYGGAIAAQSAAQLSTMEHALGVNA